LIISTNAHLDCIILLHLVWIYAKKFHRNSLSYLFKRIYENKSSWTNYLWPWCRCWHHNWLGVHDKLKWLRCEFGQFSSSNNYWESLSNRVNHTWCGHVNWFDKMVVEDIKKFTTSILLSRMKVQFLIELKQFYINWFTSYFMNFH